MSGDPLWPDRMGGENRSATEFEVKGKMKERNERESDRRRREMTDLLVLSRPAKSMQNAAGFSRKTLIYWAC